MFFGHRFPARPIKQRDPKSGGALVKGLLGAFIVCQIDVVRSQRDSESQFSVPASGTGGGTRAEIVKTGSKCQSPPFW